MSAMNREAYEAVIGLEVHTHLLTRSKLFCGCSTKFGAEPNANVCPICMGMPGVLPVLNRFVVELAIRAGLAAHCSIAPYSIFDRKSYFYPDLPKGYQISQYETPVCKGGYIEIASKDGAETKRIRLVRIHLEEDAGAYLRALHGILRYTEVSDARMEEGSMRCDVNVSVRLRGAKEYGVKTEIKNLN